eukprot:4222932-Prymnesium_polylepis.2
MCKPKRLATRLPHSSMASRSSGERPASGPRMVGGVRYATALCAKMSFTQPRSSGRSTAHHRERFALGTSSLFGFPLSTHHFAASHRLESTSTTEGDAVPNARIAKLIPSCRCALEWRSRRMMNGGTFQ